MKKKNKRNKKAGKVGKKGYIMIATAVAVVLVVNGCN